MSDHSHEKLDEHDERLEALEARIRRLEKALADREAGPVEPYYESGSINPEMDDQSITP